MRVKSPDAASASADAKATEADQPKHVVSTTAVIHEPKVDWLPLAWAPLRYNSYGYIRSAEKWGENLRAKVKQFATSISSMHNVPMPEYSFGSNKNWEARITTEGLTTIFAAKGGLVFAHFDGLIHQDGRMLVGGDPDELLNDKVWKEPPPQQKSAAWWHRRLLSAVLNSVRRDFGEALNTGSAHVMARRNTVLAPFERVAWDQWQYFKLDEPEPVAPEWEHQQYEWAKPLSPPVRWFDPRNCGWEKKGYRPSTATGPAGEKLYAIHVAPGVDRAESGKQSLEEKCTRWLVDLMTEFPERSPKARAALIEDAVAMFPGLTKRGFQRCFFSAQRETGNSKWSSAGAPRKSLR